jgi:purine nucleoside phosphorylase
VLRVGRHAKLEDVLVVTIPPGKPPVEWYVDLPGRMAQAGLRRIELLAPAWWIGEEAAPSTAWVVDHIACHLPSPLTGSEAARHGKAFLSMRRAYDVSHVAASLCLDDAELREMPVAVVWHTGGGGEPGQEEVRRARSAGCAVVSANVAPWAVGARAAGCEFAACVRISELQ